MRDASKSCVDVSRGRCDPLAHRRARQGGAGVDKNVDDVKTTFTNQARAHDRFALWPARPTESGQVMILGGNSNPKSEI